MENKMHPFERTLGQGPYKFVGFFDLGSVVGALQSGNVNGYNNGLAKAPEVERGMGTCAHCGHAILNIFIVQIGNGQRFGVGSDCIEKVGLPARELSKVKRIELDRAREQRAKRKQAKGVKARAELVQLSIDHADSLIALPHPSEYRSKQGDSLLSYINWSLIHTKETSLVYVLAHVKKALKK